MDQAKLQQLLLHTFSSDKQLRTQAEEAISQLPNIPQALLLLLQILHTPNLAREVRQATAIALKNLIHKQWLTEKPNTNEPYYADAERVQYRAAVLEGLLNESADRSVRNLLAECVHYMARTDFPNKWAELIPSICTALQSGVPFRMCNALLVLRKVVKLYEYQSEEGRGPLNVIVIEVFPMLRALFNTCLTNNELVSGEMMHLMCKTYWSAVQFHMPLCMTASIETEFLPWMEMFNTLLAKSIPEASEGLEPANQPTTDEDRYQWPWWKCKKWILQILCRLNSRWGNPKNVEAEYEKISHVIRLQLGPRFLGTVMETLALRSAGKHCPDRVVQLSLAWIANAIEPAATYKLIKPHLKFLLFQVIHPLLCLTQKDLELWEEDPHEFVRKAHDVFEDFFDPVMAANNLLADLCRKRRKDCLTDTLGFYNGILQTFMQKPVPERSFADYIQKEAALHALQSLAPTLTSDKGPFKSKVEGLLKEQVLPEFQSPHGFLRLRACRMLGKHYVDNVVFQDEQMLVHILHAILACMQDKELPVRIEAAKSLRTLVVYQHSEVVLHSLRPILPQVLDAYFKLMDEIGNDEVVCALETIIDQFGEEIGPFAAQLIEKFCECFQQFSSAGDDDDEAVMAAMQCLDAITTILVSVHRQPQFYHSVAGKLVPILAAVLTDEAAVEYLDSALDILSSITYYGNVISPVTWQVFPLIFICFETFGWDYLSSLVPVIDNFIGGDVDGFVNGQVVPTGTLYDNRDPNTSIVTVGVTYVELVFKMITSVMCSGNEVDEMELICICRLLNSILHNCFKRVDKWVPTMVELVVQGLNTYAQQEKIVFQFLKVVAGLFHYNPTITLESLERLNATEGVFKLWLGGSQEQQANRTRSVFDKKLLSLALASLIRVPVSQLPPMLRSNVQPIILQVSQVLRSMVEQEYKEREQANCAENNQNGDHQIESSNNNGNSGGSSSVPEDGYGSGDDVDDLDEDSYAAMIRDLQQEAELSSGMYDHFDDEEDDYSSGLDDIEPISFFLETLNVVTSQDQATYGDLQTSLGSEFMSLCQALSKEAEQRKALAAEQQQALDQAKLASSS